MSYQIYFENNLLAFEKCARNVLDLKKLISKTYGVSQNDLYVTFNGRRISDDFDLTTVTNLIRVYLRQIGGKGGFGSLLRAVGAQIKKTSNNEACRDLSGRRLRDINEEKRLREWFEGKDERERAVAERKLKKRAKLISEPKIDVKLSPEYVKDRDELPQRVSEAVDAGWDAVSKSQIINKKRKCDDSKTNKSKKSKLWIDAELTDFSTSEDEDVEELEPCTAQSVSSHNEGKIEQDLERNANQMYL